MSSRLEKRVIIFCLLLAAVTLAFYNPIVHNNFVDFDDLSYILKDNHVLAGVSWDTVKWSFTTFRDGNWHPLTWLSHALDCQLFGLTRSAITTPACYCTRPVSCCCSCCSSKPR